MKPIVTEKAVMMIERDNVLTFITSKNETKDKMKEKIEEMFKVKVDKTRSLIRGNKKYFYVKLKKDFLAIDVATKLGLM